MITNEMSEEILDLVAKRSPPAYAKTIRKRNSALLKALNKEVEYSGEVGCPHCLPTCKSSCLWRKSIHELYPRILSQGLFACTLVKFNGVCLFNVPGINYSVRGEDIEASDKWQPEEWEQAAAFLQGHIDWTRHPQWGKDYVE